jgi:hypothetical protein
MTTAAPVEPAVPTVAAPPVEAPINVPGPAIAPVREKEQAPQIQAQTVETSPAPVRPPIIPAREADTVTRPVPRLQVRQTEIDQQNADLVISGQGHSEARLPTTKDAEGPKVTEGEATPDKPAAHVAPSLSTSTTGPENTTSSDGTPPLRRTP